MKTLIGIVVVALHAGGFFLLAKHCRGTDLTVDVHAPLASPSLALDGVVPKEIEPRVSIALEQDAPGLARRTWSVKYRGGYARSIGAAQLVGPFQDAAKPACTGRVVMGQRLLDDGSGGPHTVAGQMKTEVTAELAGLSIVGIGDFKRIDGLKLSWAQLEKHPEDRALVKAAPHGYVRATAKVVFDRVDVPITIVLLPELKTTELKFTIRAAAKLDFSNGIVQWVSDKIGGDKMATKFTNRQIDQGLISALKPPPPFELDDQTLTFVYCDGQAEIVDGEYGAIPFGVQIGRVDRDPTILPPMRGPAPKLPIAKDAALAIDLDLDALNALLFELWRNGYLDKRLVAAGLDKRFNTDPIVTEFLSVRISAPRLALPPVLAPRGKSLRLAADARVGIQDGDTKTIGRVWGGLDFAFGTKVESVSVDLGALELSCERTPTLLVPCYADLVNAIRDRGDAFHGELTQTFATLLTDIFVQRRLSDSSLPADLVIESATPSVTTTATNASLHLDLAAKLVTRQ